MSMINATQAAKLYGCSRANIYYLVKSGCLKPIMEKPLLLDQAEVVKLAKANTPRGGKRGPC